MRRGTKTMKKLTLFAIFAALMISSAAFAQTTASGTLSVTATVNGTISLVFNSDAAGVTLGGAGTNAATLAFGTVQAFGGEHYQRQLHAEGAVKRRGRR
jgi:glycerol-3-phosphate dehydrogenase